LLSKEAFIRRWTACAGSRRGVRAAHSAWRERVNDLSDSLKISMFLGEYFVRHYRERYYTKVQNIVWRLKAAYDAAAG